MRLTGDMRLTEDMIQTINRRCKTGYMRQSTGDVRQEM